MNVTSDSEKGWIPSVDLEARALATLQHFETNLDEGRVQDAFGLFGAGLQRMRPFAEFAAQENQFRQVAGSRIGKRILAINWTKGSIAQPLPGIYAAVDVSYRYAKVERHCGYVILHASDENAAFTIERIEANYLDDAMATQIAREKSPAEVARLWQELSANCPNYRQ